MRTDVMRLTTGSAGILPASALIQSGATGRQDAGAPGQARLSLSGSNRKSVIISHALPDMWLRFPFPFALRKTVWNTN